MDLKKTLASLFVFVSTFSGLNNIHAIIFKPGEFVKQDIRSISTYTHNEIVQHRFENLYLFAKKAWEENKLLMTLDQALECIDKVFNEENTILVVASGRIKLINCLKPFVTFWIEEAVDYEDFSTGQKLGGVYPWR